MIIKYDEKIIVLQILYYGPTSSGKTTLISTFLSQSGEEELIRSVNS